MLLAFLILSAAATPPAKATCGATKFTLNKPMQPQAAPKPVEARPAPKPKTQLAKAKAKTKPLADCDKPKKG